MSIPCECCVQKNAFFEYLIRMNDYDALTALMRFSSTGHAKQTTDVFLVRRLVCLSDRPSVRGPSIWATSLKIAYSVVAFPSFFVSHSLRLRRFN